MLTKNGNVVFGEKLGWISVINHHILMEFSKNYAQSLTFYLIYISIYIYIKYYAKSVWDRCWGVKTPQLAPNY